MSRSTATSRWQSSAPSLLMALLFGLALAALSCEAAPPGASEDLPEPEAWITINGTRVALELANTPSEQRVGLGGRDSLAWNHGMLFLYQQAGFPGFWMRGMRFDIDIVWIRGDQIVDISHRVHHVPGGNGPTVRPRELTDKVLEVPAGYAAAQGWRIGQRVVLERG